ncbi:hypothetical protein ACH6CV_16415 [Bacillota bacterium Meth-B3]
MKKFLSSVLVLALLFSAGFALAEGADFASMKDDELHALINGARNELTKREMVAAEKTVLLERDGITVYLTGEHKTWGDGGVLGLEAVVVNDSENTVNVMMNSASVNGWNVLTGGIFSVESKKKKKNTFEIRIHEAELSSYEAIEDMEFVLRVSDSNSYDKIFETDKISLHFNAT